MNQFGWITKDNQVLLCKEYDHFETLREFPEITKYVDIDGIIESLDWVQQDCCNLAQEGEHPEWHHYEMYEDSCRDRVWSTLLKNGFIRFGIAYNDDERMYFEGLPEVIKDKYEKCKSVAENNDRTAKFNPQKV